MPRDTYLTLIIDKDYNTMADTLSPHETEQTRQVPNIVGSAETSSGYSTRLREGAIPRTNMSEHALARRNAVERTSSPSPARNSPRIDLRSRSISRGRSRTGSRPSSRHVTPDMAHARMRLTRGTGSSPIRGIRPLPRTASPSSYGGLSNPHSTMSPVLMRETAEMMPDLHPLDNSDEVNVDEVGTTGSITKPQVHTNAPADDQSDVPPVVQNVEGTTEPQNPQQPGQSCDPQESEDASARPRDMHSPESDVSLTFEEQYRLTPSFSLENDPFLDPVLVEDMDLESMQEALHEAADANAHASQAMQNLTLAQEAVKDDRSDLTDMLVRAENRMQNAKRSHLVIEDEVHADVEARLRQLQCQEEEEIERAQIEQERVRKEKEQADQERRRLYEETKQRLIEARRRNKILNANITKAQTEIDKEISARDALRAEAAALTQRANEIEAETRKVVLRKREEAEQRASAMTAQYKQRKEKVFAEIAETRQQTAAINNCVTTVLRRQQETPSPQSQASALRQASVQEALTARLDRTLSVQEIPESTISGRTSSHKAQGAELSRRSSTVETCRSGERVTMFPQAMQSAPLSGRQSQGDARSEEEAYIEEEERRMQKRIQELRRRKEEIKRRHAVEEEERRVLERSRELRRKEEEMQKRNAIEERERQAHERFQELRRLEEEQRQRIAIEEEKRKAQEFLHELQRREQELQRRNAAEQEKRQRVQENLQELRRYEEEKQSSVEQERQNRLSRHEEWKLLKARAESSAHSRDRSHLTTGLPPQYGMQCKDGAFGSSHITPNLGAERLTSPPPIKRRSEPSSVHVPEQDSATVVFADHGFPKIPTHTPSDPISLTPVSQNPQPQSQPQSQPQPQTQPPRVQQQTTREQTTLPANREHSPSVAMMANGTVNVSMKEFLEAVRGSSSQAPVVARAPAFEPPTFSGKVDESLDQWFRDLDEYASCVHWTTAQKVAAMPMILQGRARQIWQDLSQQERSDWNFVADVLKGHFGDDLSTTFLNFERLGRKQKRNESVRDYAEELSRRMRLAGITDEASKQKWFFAGLLPRLRAQVIAMKPTCLREMERYACMAETSQRSNADPNEQVYEEAVQMVRHDMTDQLQQLSGEVAKLQSDIALSNAARNADKTVRFQNSRNPRSKSAGNPSDRHSYKNHPQRSHSNGPVPHSHNQRNSNPPQPTTPRLKPKHPHPNKPSPPAQRTPAQRSQTATYCRSCQTSHIFGQHTNSVRDSNACFLCKKTGHMKEDCPERVCIRCKEKGHQADTCRAPPKCAQCKTNHDEKEKCPPNQHLN